MLKRRRIRCSCGNALKKVGPNPNDETSIKTNLWECKKCDKIEKIKALDNEA